MFFKRWKVYDPRWLAEDCQYAFSEYPWLEDALKPCCKARKRSAFYTYFEKHSRPNEPSSNWQIQESIHIEGTREGDIILDIIKENRVGGIEFISRLMK